MRKKIFMFLMTASIISSIPRMVYAAGHVSTTAIAQAVTGESITEGTVTEAGISVTDDAEATVSGNALVVSEAEKNSPHDDNNLAIVSGTAINTEKLAAIERVSALKDAFLNRPDTPPSMSEIKNTPVTMSMNLPTNGVARFEIVYTKNAEAPYFGISIGNGAATIPTMKIGESGAGWAYKDGGIVDGYEESLEMAVLYVYDYTDLVVNFTINVPQSVREMIIIMTEAPETANELKKLIEQPVEECYEPTEVVTWYAKSMVTEEDNTISSFTANTLWEAASQHFRPEDIETTEYQAAPEPEPVPEKKKSVKGIVLLTIILIAVPSVIVLFIIKRKEANTNLEIKRRKRNRMHEEMEKEVWHEENDVPDPNGGLDYSDDEGIGEKFTEQGIVRSATNNDSGTDVKAVNERKEESIEGVIGDKKRIMPVRKPIIRNIIEE